MSGITAKYIRLSAEDNDLGESGKTESNSITNQRNLLDAFISRTSELADSNVIEFCDDGWSGKNFERPGFQEMIAKARAGKIQCIVVKDLSRFGRDYLTVGNYISSVFPFLGVRFIAVNDGFDSIRPADIDSLETSFRALIYDFYSRDLSRKIRSIKRFRAQQGDFLSSFAPYGYIKDPAHKKRLIIDPEAAEIVRRIFRLTADGQKKEEIARQLNREGVPTPMLYKRAAGCTRTKWNNLFDENFWTGSLIYGILRDERYVGRIVYGKHTRDRIGHAHVVRVDREDWIIVDDTHEGIVTQEEFDCVQAAIRASGHGAVKNHNHPLQKKIRCGICGYAMSRVQGSAPYFVCRTSRMNAAYTCRCRTPEADILETVTEGLRVQASIAVELSRLWEEQRQGRKKDIATARKNLAGLREKHQRLSQQVSGLYESFVMGEVSKAEYLAAKAAAVRQRDDAAAQISEMEAVLDNMGADGSLRNGFVSAFGKFLEVEEITDEIAADVLKEVRIHPGGRIETVWNYRDELKRLILDLQGDHQDGEQESLDLLQGCLP
ncbi:recombinase family protein [uncultured Oscillibacter sp.]|uniref:recombinase family protein n=1 Tax=uncultured Oscillibacter sp. TaxID=876091 RepID=UPI002615CFF8|nr:recombinase family protein [uncultured Oscillibacter sp.]